MRDAVVEIRIENAVAREAFIRWWRTMEAQGYSYGYEALCNVWVGFDDGRSDLARKVLETIETRKRPYSRHDMLMALRELLIREGVTTNAAER